MTSHSCCTAVQDLQPRPGPRQATPAVCGGMGQSPVRPVTAPNNRSPERGATTWPTCCASRPWLAPLFVPESPAEKLDLHHAVRPYHDNF